ncbi:MAG: NifU-like domain protein [Bryobacterales bacterium]|jgi:Fe-S cluster biogenesis protein NfuA|nr:NifU-like domain protein [Bryobacterales bacterium]
MGTDGNAKSDEERVRRIEGLVRRLEQIADPESRTVAEQLMEAVLELHGAGLEKMMDIVFESGASGEAILRRFANDSLVSSLLVLHELHPDDLETRVRQTLAKAPGHAELLSVYEGVVRVRLSAGGCGSSETDEESLKLLLREAVPDIAEVIVQQSTAMNSFVPLLSINGIPSRAG